MKKKIFIAVLFALAISAFAVSENAGTCEMTFLKMQFSPHAAAMGGAFTGFATGPDAMLANPASMTFEKETSVGTSFGVLYAGITGGDVVAQRGFSFGKLGLGLRFLTYGTLDQTNDQGEVIGTFGATDLAISAAYSREIVENIAIGIAPFFASSSIDTTSATAIGVDIGALYKFDHGRGRVGLALKNAGSIIAAHVDTSGALPLNASIGASYRLKGLPVYASAQGDWFADDGYTAGFGLEVVQLKPLYLRAGYKLREKVEGDFAEGEILRGLTAGFGLSYKGIIADYAFEHYGVLGMTHKFAVAYDGFVTR